MILIRTECGRRQGWGHLMRCLTIADELTEVGEQAFFLVSGDADQAKLLLDGRYPHRFVEDDDESVARSVLTAAQAWKANVILLDGYNFTDTQEQAIIAGGKKLVVMDDFGHNRHTCANLIVNGNLHYAHRDLYTSASTDARLLLGPTYAPLRSALRRHRLPKRMAQDTVHSVLVLMGGSDAGGILGTVLDHLIAATDERVTLKVASEALQPTHGRLGWQEHLHRITWVRDPEVVAREMSICDVAVAAGGISSYELAFMGVPTLLAPANASQAPVSAELAKRGAALLLVPGRSVDDFIPEAFAALCSSASMRQRMTEAAQAIFDGEGARRIAHEMRQLVRASS